MLLKLLPVEVVGFASSSQLIDEEDGRGTISDQEFDMLQEFEIPDFCSEY